MKYNKYSNIYLPFKLNKIHTNFSRRKMKTHYGDGIFRFAVLLVFIGVVYGLSTIDKEWAAFKEKHNKKYNPTEDKMRFELWMKRKSYIEEHNINVSSLSQGDRGRYLLDISDNHRSDWTDKEYKGILGYRRPQKFNIAKLMRRGSTINDLSTSVQDLEELIYRNTVPVSDLPSYVNWTAQGYVTPVQDQGQCGDCWAFSAAGSLEGLNYNTTRKSVILSEQNLLDCSSMPPYNNSGCDGGNMDLAFMYVIFNQGIDTYYSYPYSGKQGPCRYSTSNSVGYVTGFKIVEPYSEAALQQAVALIGPISVGINANLPSFQTYKTGVYQPSNFYCNEDDLDHAVLAVGYGTYEGQDYWLLKNSWGTGWGMQGYMMLARNDNNLCGIATQASFPTGFVLSGNNIMNDGYPNSATANNMSASIVLMFVVTTFYSIVC